jgi:Flp pilus assembly protein TadD
MLRAKKRKLLDQSFDLDDNGHSMTSHVRVDQPLEDELSPKQLKRFKKAVSLAKKGRLEEALDIVDELVEEDPMNTHAWRLKGDIHTQLGDEEMAELCAL